MTIFNVFSLLGGLALFLFGMDIMGKALEKQAGGQLQKILSKLTDNPLKGFFLGLCVTAVIQSSSATTVMVVGFVNSGIMELHQAIGVIMGSNVGTTVTSWILSLSGLQGDSLLIQLLKPTSFSPVLAFIGILLYMCKSEKKKGVGTILIGFAVLMTGMTAMSNAVLPLQDEAWFTSLFTRFSNPLLGVLVGAHAFIVGSSFLQSRNLLAIVHPILRQLMEDSGETVNLAVLDQSDHQAIIIDQVQCTQLMRMSAPIGGKLPMHASGAGKAFLSQLSEEQVTSLLHRKGLHAYTHATLVSPLHLKEDLAQTRKRGYSFDDEEHALGLRCVAACIYDEHREPFAAISISGPISRMTDDRVTELGALVIKAAKEVTLAYGGVK